MVDEGKYHSFMMMYSEAEDFLWMTTPVSYKMTVGYTVDISLY